MRAFFSRLVLSCCFAGAVWFTVGCGRNEDALVDRTVQARLDDFARKKRQECRAALLAEAGRIVDSLLLAEAKMQLEDSLARRRPTKPIQPPLVPALDSLPVKPIFQ